MMNRTVLPATIAVALMLMASAGLSACGSSSAKSPPPAATVTAAAVTAATTTTTAGSSSEPSRVKVALNEFTIAPAATSAPAGHVVFVVRNSGKLKHQFTIIRTNKSAATVLSKQDPNDDIAGARGEIATIAPGTTKTLTIKNLKPGHYALVCALPGHYQAGMHADFTVN